MWSSLVLKTMREEAFWAYRDFVKQKVKCRTFNVKNYEHGLTCLQKSFMEAYLIREGLLSRID